MNANLPTQLPLTLNWQDYATFDNYFSGENTQAVSWLKNIARGEGEHYIYLYGGSGSGLSHLLQACCQMAADQGRTAAYVPLMRSGFVPEILDGLETLDLICIDDIQAIASQRAWEEKIFHLYNQLLARSGNLIVASQESIKQLPWQLSDLASRLMAGVVFQIKPLSDEQKAEALRMRAQMRGL